MRRGGGGGLGQWGKRHNGGGVEIKPFYNLLTIYATVTKTHLRGGISDTVNNLPHPIDCLVKCQ